MNSKHPSMWSDSELCEYLRALGEAGDMAADYIQRLKGALDIAQEQAMSNGSEAARLQREVDQLEERLDEYGRDR